PAIEVFGAAGGGDELHVREAMAAVVAGHATELAGLVGDQVQLRAHAGHRVDLSTQLRDEEGVHSRVGGDVERQRAVGREVELVDGGDAQVRVHEHPLPVGGDH